MQGRPKAKLNKANILRLLKWLYPGMKVKRWIVLCSLGILLVAIGSVRLFSGQVFMLRIAGSLILLTGIVLLITGVRKMVNSFITIFLPQREKELVNIVYQKRQLERGPKIVAIGGGTGLSALLHGIKEYTSNITAIVTVADEGGSSGRLREQFDILPPGDIRNCLVALADAEPLMRNLFQFRFDRDSEFHGHNFGNMFITAMTKVIGDFEEAIKESSRVLAIRGRVIPSTLRKVRLVAEHQDGSTTKGETYISKSAVPIKRVYLKPDGCKPTLEALTAIEEADAVVIGPGSLYTSIIPNLLIIGMSEAISNSRALKVYVCNVMTQSGETEGYTAFDHLNALISHTQSGLIDCCIINIGDIPKGLLAKYREENSYPVIADSQRIRDLGYSVVEDKLISAVDLVRHDSEKLARTLIDLIIDTKRGV